jgi:hypothetical protein
MYHLTCLVINDDGPTGLWIHIPRRTVAWIYIVRRIELLAIGNRVIDLLWRPTPLLHLVLPLLRRFIIA